MVPGREWTGGNRNQGCAKLAAFVDGGRSASAARLTLPLAEG
jgi:hypothetical protein